MDSKPINYTVSEQTAKLLQAYDLMNSIYEVLYDGLNLIYREEDSLEIIEKEVMPAYEALESAILKIISKSIIERRGHINSCEI